MHCLAHDRAALTLTTGTSLRWRSMAGSDRPRRELEHDSDTLERPATKTPRRFHVLFHNDDYTTMEFVVEVLRAFFNKTEADALHIMMTVHKKGKAIAGTYSRDVAETKIAQVTEYAKASGMPLLLTAEPE